ncbi:unnamed protein product [Allacma fusca]|uniref:Cytochrome P450 n=1 Tax=Allacma fusca TaxID=39272 RepID=A0A8J2PZ60_9HEXA|nr:unnamed protein product [Allacma fusca]
MHTCLNGISKMIYTQFLLAATAGLLLLLLFKKWAQYRGIPPGPWGLPIVGYMPFLLKGDPIQMFQEFKKKYGKVFSISIGNFNCVVINDYKLIIEAYKEDVFLGRPAFEIQITRSHGQKRGILFAEGNVWAEQRRFAARTLRNFGIGNKNSMETLLQNEAQELGNFLAANVDKPMSLKSRFNASVLNSLWYICTGSRFDVEDPDFLFLITNIIDNFQKAESTGVVFFFPWVLKKDFLIKGFWKKYLETRDKTQGLIKASIAEHEKTYSPTENRDLIDALIEHRKKSNNPDSSFYGSEGEMNQLIVLLDLFVAGAETSSSILQWAMLYMIIWPEVQAKVQEEIDSVIGSSRIPSLEDKPNMIYTEAVLCEIHRFCTLVPFSVYHSTLADTKFAGYKIPKDTCIFANMRDAHHDKEFQKVPGATLSIQPNAKTFIVAPKPYEIIIQTRA